jgi:hypothetical protein
MTDTKDTDTGGRTAASGPFARLGADLDNILRSFIPSEDVFDHFAKARIEVLKGVRAMIDARIDRLSSEAKKGVSVTIE